MMTIKQLRILIIRGTVPFAPDSPAGIRMSNLIKNWVGRGVEVTFCQYLDKSISPQNMEKIKGATLDFIHLTPWQSKIFRRADVIFSLFWPFWLHSALHTIHLYFHVRKKYKRGDFDLVFTSLPPFSNVFIGRLASRYFRVPWIADFRDIPDEYDIEHKMWGTRFASMVTKRYLRSAMFSVSVTTPWVEALKTRFGVKEAHEIPNGYEGGLPASSGCHKTDEFLIFFAGIVGYDRPMLLERMLDAIALMKERCVDVSKIKLIIAGNYNEASVRNLKAHSQSSNLLLLGRIPREKVVEYERNASVLLNLSCSYVPGVVPSKIFEYAKARRPVLNVPTKNDLPSCFIMKAGIGSCCETKEEIADYLERKLKEWQKSGVVADPEIKVDYAQRFSRDRLADEYLDLIISRMEGAESKKLELW